MWVGGVLPEAAACGDVGGLGGWWYAVEGAEGGWGPTCLTADQH